MHQNLKFGLLASLSLAPTSTPPVETLQERLLAPLATVPVRTAAALPELPLQTLNPIRANKQNPKSNKTLTKPSTT